MRKILFILCLSFLLSGCSFPEPHRLTKMEYRGTEDVNGNKYDEEYILHFTRHNSAGRTETLRVYVSKETYESCTLEKKEKDNGKD